jgi:hypothetical protein
MDRANNAIGLRIGVTAEGPLDVIAAAQAEVERAFLSGPSLGDRAHWLPPAQWSDPAIGASDAGNWPPRSWPNYAADQALGDYPGNAERSRYRLAPHDDTGSEGPVFVRPHMGYGHHVDGYTRSPPTR